jgi:hypothetical protein
MGTRCAIVEEMGETSGHGVIEISTVKQVTGGGKITGAAMRQNEIQGEIKFKLLTLMNRVPHIEPDDAMRRRVHDPEIAKLRKQGTVVLTPSGEHFLQPVKTTRRPLHQPCHRFLQQVVVRKLAEVFNPQPCPQNAMSCTTSACLSIPRGSCKLL